MPLLTLSGSNYRCLERISMVLKMFEPLRFDCICIFVYHHDKMYIYFTTLVWIAKAAMFLHEYNDDSDKTDQRGIYQRIPICMSKTVSLQTIEISETLSTMPTSSLSVTQIYKPRFQSAVRSGMVTLPAIFCSILFLHS